MTTEAKDGQTSVNDSGTQAGSDTNLTQPRSGFELDLTFENTRRELHRRGSAAGWHTRDGHTYSNLNEQLENMRTYVRPDWATDVRQTLPYQIQQQMKRLPPRAV